MQAVLPKDPDEQKQILLIKAEEDMNIIYAEDDQERYAYYLTNGIKDSDLCPYNNIYYIEALKRIPQRYKQLKIYKSMITNHKDEILHLYNFYMRKNLLHYILKDPKERKRIRITRLPRDYPILVIRAPVPWHSSFCLSKQLMEKHFYNGNIIILEIRDLWEKFYSKMLIIPTDRLEENQQFPLEMIDLENLIDDICQQSRDILVKEWLPSCADVFLKQKLHWKKYIPLKASDSPVLIEKFFDCVNSLLSMQLRSLVMRSLKHFLNFIIKFKVSK